MCNNNQLIFMDDSGDPGFKGAASSPAFVMAAVMFTNLGVVTELNHAIDGYRQSLGWHERHEFKFNKATKKIRVEFLKIISKYDMSIYAVYFRKEECPEIFKFLDDEKMYNWVTRELLALMDPDNATVKTDGKYDKKYKLHVKAYIRRTLNDGKKRIKDFDVHDSKKDNLIQLADMVAGTVNRSLQSGKTDNNDYIRIIRRRIVKLEKMNIRDKIL